MKKYLEPNIEIRELLFEDVVTTSGVPVKLTNGGHNGTLGDNSTYGDSLVLQPTESLYFD